MQRPEELNLKFEIPDALRFEEGAGGLVRAVIATPIASAEIYLHGAHVTHYVKRGSPNILFLSGKSQFSKGKAIRGGVPICFPWFSQKKDDPSAVFHGFARISEWQIDSTTRHADGIQITFALGSDERTRAMWPYDFRARYSVTVGDTLQLALTITNTGATGFEFEEALHTYLQVGDIRQTRVDGLANTEYLDKVQGNRKVAQGDLPILFSGETDRIYLNTLTTCTAEDAGNGRRIVVGKENSDTTVVWNPWIEKTKTLSDMSPDDWTRMLCIETSNVKEAAIRLAPGESHSMTAIISTEKM